MPEMKPVDIRAFKKGEGNALVLALGVWADKDTAGWIRIDLTGPKDFHTTVTNNPKSERFHRTLYSRSATSTRVGKLLALRGRWRGNRSSRNETGACRCAFRNERRRPASM